MTRDARSRSPICQGDRLARERGRGVAEANATISGYLFAAAKTGYITAIMFWLKRGRIGVSGRPRMSQFRHRCRAELRGGPRPARQ